MQDLADTRSIRSNPGSESHSASADETSSGDSIDSGVVLRMAKMFGEVEGGRAKESSRISRESNNLDLSIYLQSLRAAIIVSCTASASKTYINVNIDHQPSSFRFSCTFDQKVKNEMNVFKYILYE